MLAMKSHNPTDAKAARERYVQGGNDQLLKDYLTEAQLATELGVSTRTLTRWRCSREAPPITRIGRRLYYSRSAVERWLANRQQAEA